MNEEPRPTGPLDRQTGLRPAASDPVPVKKIIPPHWHEGLLHRDRLTNRIERALRLSRGCMICAPPGYGKTTLLADFAQENARPQVWIRLDADDRDPRRLACCLSAAVDHALAKDSLTDLSAPQVSSFTAPRHQVVTAAARLSVPVRELLLLLDDVDEVFGSDSAIDVLCRFLGALPEHLFVIMTTRLPLRQPLANLYPAHRMFRIGPQDLRFTTEEAERYLMTVGIPVENWPRILQELSSYEGWPAAIPLLSWASSSETSRGRILDAERTFRDLAQTVLDSLTPSEVAILRQIAGLERINVDLCRDCLGISHAAETLARLADRNVFLETCDSPGEYRLHSLFRKFLICQPGWSLTLDNQLHQRVAEWLLHTGDTVSAVHHLIAADQMAAANHLLPDACRTLANAGRFREVLDLLERAQSAAGGDLPPHLVRWRAHALFFLGNLTRAMEESERALQDLRTDESCRADLLALVSFVKSQRGELYEDVGSIEPTIIMRCDISPSSKIDYLRALASPLVSKLDWQSALDKFERALMIAQEMSPSNSALVAAEISAILQMQGHLRKAEEYAQGAIALGESLNVPFAVALAYNNMATLHHVTGNYSSALSAIEQGNAIARKHFRLAVQVTLLLSEGDLLLDLMRPDSARLCYLRAAALARDVELPQETAYAHRALSHLYRQGGDLTASRAELELAAQWLQPWQRFDWLQHHYACAWLAIAEGRVEEGVDQLRETVEGFQQGGARLWEARSRLALAYGLYTSTGIDDALPELDALLALIKDIGENQFLIPEAARMPRLWAAVVHAGRRDLCSALSEPDLRPRPSAQSRGLPNTARYSDPAPALLEPREREIVIGLCEGLTREEVGSRLGLSLSTINKSISDIYAATGFTKTHQLVAWAHRCGLYSPAEAPPPQIHDAPSAYRPR